jgi:two-component system sensor histidine kinase DegS
VRVDRREWAQGSMSGSQLSEGDLLVMREERHRLVRELEDGPLQSLAGLGLRLDLCQELTKSGESAAVADELANLKLDLGQILAGIRGLMTELRCPRLEDLSLVRAIDDCLHDCERRSGIRVIVDLAQLPDESLGIEQKLAVFRIVQQALRNVSQHSGASEVAIRARMRESLVELSIEDNGRGFSVVGVTSSYPRRGVGLAGMQERAKAIGGRVEIDSRSGRGTHITLIIPIDHRDA